MKSLEKIKVTHLINNIAQREAGLNDGYNNIYPSRLNVV